MADKLLRHPVPYMNESIGNYVLRLCSDNSCGVNQIAGLIGFYLSDIESFYGKLKEKHITKLSELTGIDIKVIEDMTANRFFLGKYYDYSCRTSSVCPKCYSERPYERIHWKNELIKVCLEHEIYLVNECPRCKNKITSDILYYGKCVCGLHINDFIYTNCVNEYVLKNQNILYKIFNIKGRISLKGWDLLYNNLSIAEYCALFYHLQYFTKIYAEHLNDLDVSYNDIGGYKSIILASWIMLDWPVNLISILKVLNNLDIRYIYWKSFEIEHGFSIDYEQSDVIKDRFVRILYPHEGLKLRIRDLYNIVFRYKELYQPLMNYYYENNNKENAKINMDRFKYLNYYVDFAIAIKIFFNIDKSDSDIEKFAINYFHIYKFNNRKHLDLEEIFNYYSKI